MTAVYITVIAVVGAIIFINLILLLLALFIKKAAFGSRCDKNPLLKYFSAEDFNLSQKVIDVAQPQKNQYIRAVLYKKNGAAPRDELIVFCHGMGPGQVAYTTEIAYFCNLGYAVFAPDYYGCNLSDGKSIKNFKNGADSVAAAVLYARENFTGYKKIYLVGHSWGGYAALVAAEQAGADKVVALSAPDRPEKAIYGAAAGRLPKFLAKLLYPYIALVCGGRSAAESAQSISSPVLLVQGEKDAVVPPQNSVYSLAQGGNIKKLEVKDRGHNPYNTVNAEKMLGELMGKLAKAKETGEEYFKNFDFSAATEEDIAVMEEIARFLA